MSNKLLIQRNKKPSTSVSFIIFVVEIIIRPIHTLHTHGQEYFYETLHSCSTQPADVHEGIVTVRCCLKFRRGDNSTYTFTFTKRGVVYLVSTTTPKLLIEFL